MFSSESGFFQSAANELSYVCCVPKKFAKPTGVLFVHADQGNRLGPHRMFVECAQAFVAQGYPVFRFDLRGCGDSSGEDAKGEMKQDLEDVINAIEFFVRHARLKNVYILGISRGARVAYNLMPYGKLPLAGLMLLSTPCSSTKAAINNVQSHLKHYGLKIRRPHYWCKLLRGHISIRGMIRTLTYAWQLKYRYQENTNQKRDKICPLLFIYGQCDPICDQALSYYQQQCQWRNMRIDSHVIAGANHSFFHYRWKEQIIEICLRWLERIDQRANDA